MQPSLAVRGFVLMLCAGAAIGCSKKNTPTPVAPTQPSGSTGSSDRDVRDTPTDTTRDDGPSSPPVRTSYGPIYYAYDSSDLDERARGELSALGEYMSGRATATVEISGHTDERGTDEYNLALGERRASSAKQFLMRLGVAGARINTISYGEERPAAEGSEESSWHLNRRCELQLADR